MKNEAAMVRAFSAKVGAFRRESRVDFADARTAAWSGTPASPACPAPSAPRLARVLDCFIFQIYDARRGGVIF